VGLSTGTLDSEWASRVEVGTSLPAAGLKALSRLQEAGIPTYGMLCPIFPDVLENEITARTTLGLEGAAASATPIDPAYAATATAMRTTAFLSLKRDWHIPRHLSGSGSYATTHSHFAWSKQATENATANAKQWLCWGVL
jgi:DNA repair photolyase